MINGLDIAYNAQPFFQVSYVDTFGLNIANDAQPYFTEYYTFTPIIILII